MEVATTGTSVESSSPRRVSLTRFVAEIEKLSKGLVTKEALCDFLGRYEPDPADLREHEHWLEHKYTRNLIFRNDMIEFMLICWRRGDITPLHTHNGQLGWMAMLRGRLLVENFRMISCNRPENQQVVGIDCLAGATRIDMQPVSSQLAVAAGPVNTVDKEQTIHRIHNLAEWDEPAVSLHIYSRPIDSCVVFDLEGQRCYRRDLTYDFV